MLKDDHETIILASQLQKIIIAFQVVLSFDEVKSCFSLLSDFLSLQRGLKKQLSASLVLLTVSPLTILNRVRKNCNWKTKLARRFMAFEICKILSSVNNKKIGQCVIFTQQKRLKDHKRSAYE